MKYGRHIFWIAFACLLSVGAIARAESDTLKLTVSILPQKYFAEQLFEPPIDINVIIGPGQSPATYEPTPKQLAAFGEAGTYYSIGMPFENGLIRKLENSSWNVPVIRTQAGIQLRPISGHTHHDGHDHGDTGETLDPHIWLDPVLVKAIAQNMSDSHKIGTYDNSGSCKQMLAEFLEKLDSLHASISRKLAPYKGQKLYVFHPSFGYFCDRYGLEQIAIETEGKEPSARQLAKLITQARADKVKAIIIQSQFSRKTAEAIAHEIGAEVISLDPLAYDYIQNMKHMADVIAEALRK